MHSGNFIVSRMAVNADLSNEDTQISVTQFPTTDGSLLSGEQGESDVRHIIRVETSPHKSKVGDPIEYDRHGTILSGFSVITKSMIGSGIFSMAYACSKFGLIAGSIFLCLAACITWLSLRVLSILALEFIGEKPTFYTVSGAIMPRARLVLDISVIINCLGGAIVYVQTAGNLMSFAIIAMFNLSSDPSAMKQQYIAMCVQAVMIVSLAPLCMMKQITSTKIPNLIGLCCLLYITICTLVYSSSDAASSTLLYPGNALFALGSFPTFIFAFTCQQNVFTVASELKNPTLKRLDLVSILSTGTGFLVYMPMMILPFLTFGHSVKSNYLYNFDDPNAPLPIPILISFIFASLSVSISFVLQVQPIRRSLVSLVFGSNPPEDGRKETTVRIAFATLILLITYGLAVGIGDDLSLPINISGLLGGNTMCFVMPFLLYLKRFGLTASPGFARAVLATLVFCIALYPICLTGEIYEIVKR